MYCGVGRKMRETSWREWVNRSGQNKRGWEGIARRENRNWGEEKSGRRKKERKNKKEQGGQEEWAGSQGAVREMCRMRTKQTANQWREHNQPSLCWKRSVWPPQSYQGSSGACVGLPPMPLCCFCSNCLCWGNFCILQDCLCSTTGASTSSLAPCGCGKGQHGVWCPLSPSGLGPARGQRRAGEPLVSNCIQWCVKWSQYGIITCRGKYSCTLWINPQGYACLPWKLFCRRTEYHIVHSGIRQSILFRIFNTILS